MLQRLLLLPLLAPLLAVLLVAALNPTPASRLRLLIWTSPALPIGVTLDPSSGALSGTPTAPTLSGSYTITATNSAGTATFSMTFTFDTTAPTVTVTRAGDGTLADGDTDTITFTLSEAATDFTARMSRLEGLKEGLQLMNEGEKARFWLTDELAFQGRPGAPKPPIVYDVEIVSFVEMPQRGENTPIPVTVHAPPPAPGRSVRPVH